MQPLKKTTACLEKQEENCYKPTKKHGESASFECNMIRIKCLLVLKGKSGADFRLFSQSKQLKGEGPDS